MKDSIEKILYILIEENVIFLVRVGALHVTSLQIKDQSLKKK